MAYCTVVVLTGQFPNYCRVAPDVALDNSSDEVLKRPEIKSPLPPFGLQRAKSGRDDSPDDIGATPTSLTWCANRPRQRRGYAPNPCVLEMKYSEYLILM